MPVQRERNPDKCAGIRGTSQGRLASAETIGPLTLDAEALQIEVGDEKTFLALEALGFGLDRAVLRDQAMPTEDYIRG